MPRLLNINNYHYRRGGSDVMYFDHAKLMEDIGWENAYFSMHHPKNYPSKWSEFFVEEIEFGHAYTLKSKAIMASKVIYSFEAQKKLSQLLSKHKPDIAHLHCIYHHLSPSILSTLKKAGIPVVLTAHDLKIACPAYKMLNSGGICERCNNGSVINVIKERCIKDSLVASTIVAMESALHRYLKSYQKNVDKIITPSKFFQQKLIEWGWSDKSIEYIPNYVDVTIFEANFRAGDYFLYFGRLAPEKGVHTLIKAARIAGIKLLIVGTGPEEQTLKELNTTINANAVFLGYKTGQDLVDLVKNARCVVLPSEWYENAPMSILESYAQGKPVIGAQIGGIPEVIKEDQTGWMFESKNIDQLASLLTKVNQLNDDQVERIGRCARDYVTTTFNKKDYVDRVVSLYAQLGVKQ